jgi:uncharacterized protein YbjT (DUF2867 family)
MKCRSDTAMHIILGGTGHIGSALAGLLSVRGEDVTIVSHDSNKAKKWRERGVNVAVADVHDVAALREIFRRGKRLFLLNPSADPATDTDVEEGRSVACILDAIFDSGLEKVVAQSTYGAQACDRCGDLGILYSMEQQLAAQAIPFSVIRAAYYMSNWDASLERARQEGVLQSFYPANFALPMVAPRDIAKVAARLMMEPVEKTGTYHVEGPEEYTAEDVASAFAHALGRPVWPVVIPRGEWVSAFKAAGFSDRAAESYAGMTAMTLEQREEVPGEPLRGETSLEEYVGTLVGELVGG